MKALSELNFPNDLHYTKDHEWARSDGDTVTIGITDYAQDQLGDVVFVEMPRPGDTFKKGDEFGAVESVKAVSELYIPVGGEVVNINTALEDAPELLNRSPYGEGWIIEISPEDPSGPDKLLNKDAYMGILKGS